MYYRRRCSEYVSRHNQLLNKLLSIQEPDRYSAVMYEGKIRQMSASKHRTPTGRKFNCVLRLNRYKRKDLYYEQ